MTEQATQETPMNSDDAFALVHQRVYAPAFFTKLAQDYNIQPQNEQEAIDMLHMASQIRYAQEMEEKRAGANSFLSAAQTHLQQELSAMGIGDTESNAAITADQHIKQAAVYASHDPELAQALLSLHMQNDDQSE